MAGAQSARFSNFLPLVLRYEGGYVNHPNDPGSETYGGISRRAHPESQLWKIVDEYKKRVGNINTADGIRQLNNLLANDSRVKDIIHNTYYSKYWVAIQAESMPYPVGEYLCDFGINAGISRAITLLQRVLRLSQDGRITQTVLDTLKKRNPNEIMDKLYIERTRYYLQITLARQKQFGVFFLGWIRRTDEMYFTLISQK